MVQIGDTLWTYPYGQPGQWYTAQELLDLSFIRFHHHHIVGLVQSCSDVKKLRRIAEIVELELPE